MPKNPVSKKKNSKSSFLAANSPLEKVLNSAPMSNGKVAIAKLRS